MRETDDRCKVWVGNIPNCFSPEDVKDYFLQWGLPVFKEIMLRTAHHETSWAIVAFSTPYEARQVMLTDREVTRWPAWGTTDSIHVLFKVSIVFL